MSRVLVRSSTMISPRVETLGLEEGGDVLGLGVGQGDRLDHDRPGELLALLEPPLVLLFPGQDGDGRDAEDVAFDRLAHLVLLEDDVEGLVPGDVLEIDGDRAPDLGVEDDVEGGDVGEVEDDVPEVGVLELHADDVAGVLLLVPDDRLGLELALLGRPPAAWTSWVGGAVSRAGVGGQTVSTGTVLASALARPWRAARTSRRPARTWPERAAGQGPPAGPAGRWSPGRGDGRGRRRRRVRRSGNPGRRGPAP